jgi:hypothetical protein
MRSHKLTPAVTAAAALLALAPAGAAAAHAHRHAVRHAAQGGACKVTLSVAPRLVTSGEAALASGQGTCGGAPAAAQPVTLYERAVGSPGFTAAGTTTTAADGSYQVPTGALTSNAAFYATVGTARSAERNVKVAAVATLAGPPETKTLFSGIHTGRSNAVTFSGTVSPSGPETTVVLQRENAVRGNEWHPIAPPVKVDANGNFSIKHAFGGPGASSIRVVVRSKRRNVASASNVLSYVISQAQNPSLTIESAQDPLAFGGSTVISGVVAGAPNTTVTLVGHGAHGKYAPVTTTTTDGSGKYSFAAQSPKASTFYRVQGAGRTSAVLYQGVKYVLTAASSASSVTSGQPLTFTGTVTPVKAGHQIYLEKQNASGSSFHVVAVGTVAGDGTYSITRSFFTPGSYVLRVKIPGDSENGGTASTTFPTTVVKTVSAKVPAESPGNGLLPPLGL